MAPVNPALDIEIDPELDMMLAELELDEEFSSLGENEQKSWLESLFFMDTKHNPGRQPRDQLSKTKIIIYLLEVCLCELPQMNIYFSVCFGRLELFLVDNGFSK